MYLVPGIEIPASITFTVTDCLVFSFAAGGSSVYTKMLPFADANIHRPYAGFVVKRPPKAIFFVFFFFLFLNSVLQMSRKQRNRKTDSFFFFRFPPRPLSPIPITPTTLSRNIGTISILTSSKHGPCTSGQSGTYLYGNPDMYIWTALV